MSRCFANLYLGRTPLLSSMIVPQCRLLNITQPLFPAFRRFSTTLVSSNDSTSFSQGPFNEAFPFFSSSWYRENPALRRDSLPPSTKSASDQAPSSRSRRRSQETVGLTQTNDSNATTRSRFVATKPATIGNLIPIYKALSKSGLSVLMVLSAMSAYAICPVDPILQTASMDVFVNEMFGPSTASSLSALLPDANTHLAPPTVSTLLSLSVGTFLASASANSFNQLVEVPYDAQMARTRGRPMCRRMITPGHAFAFSAITGTTGITILYALVNPLTASLGLANLLLYTLVYTPMKRMSILNTWVGAIVGGIPPLMGWAACAGTISPLTQPGAWALAVLLFSWQFPHFNSLSHNLRAEYAQAGYRMTSVTNPALNSRVGLRHALGLLPLCSVVIPYLGLTTWHFAYLSLLPNLPFAWTAWRFWRKRTEERARWAFWASIIQLPAVLVIMMGCKYDLWN